MKECFQKGNSVGSQHSNPTLEMICRQSLAVLQVLAAFTKDIHGRGTATHDDKENQSGNVQRLEKQAARQLTFPQDILFQLEDICLELASISHNKMGSQIQQSNQQLSLLITTKQDVQAALDGLKNYCASRAVKEQGGLIRTMQELAVLLEKLEENQLILEQDCPYEIELKGVDSSKGSKRSLLTEKIKQAEQEEEQSEQILKTIRMNPGDKVYGNLIEQTKIRDRTAPLKFNQLQSHFKQQKFSFSELGSIEINHQQSRSKARSSRLIMSEMLCTTAQKQRKPKHEGMGCSKCQIY